MRRAWATLIAVCRLLIAVASLVAEHGLLGEWALGEWASVAVVPELWSTDSIVVTYGLSCSRACEISLDQGLSPCLLHCQEDTLPLSLQGSPTYVFL